MTQKMHGITLARMTHDDIDGVLEVERLSFSSPWSEGMLHHEVDNGAALYIVAKDSATGKVVGHGGTWLAVGEAHITNIAVHPKWRKRGIGKELTTALLHDCRAMGVTHVTLEVRVSNYAAQQLYKQLGFGPAGVRKKYYTDNGEDAILMVADFTPLDDMPKFFVPKQF